MSYNETFNRFSLYFLAMLISPILFGVLLAIYSITFLQDSWNFGPAIMVVILYSFPFFMFGALPVSLYIDFSARIKNCSKWMKKFLYAGFGSLAGLLGSVVLYDLIPILSMLIFGMVGGVIHYFILALIKMIIK